MHNVFVTEALKHGDKVRESFVERQHVRTARLREVSAQTIQHCVSDFVRDDVVRKAGEYKAAGTRAVRGMLFGLEVTEAQLAVSLVVVSVLLVARVRKHAQFAVDRRAPIQLTA